MRQQNRDCVTRKWRVPRLKKKVRQEVRAQVNRPTGKVGPLSNLTPLYAADRPSGKSPQPRRKNMVGNRQATRRRGTVRKRGAQPEAVMHCFTAQGSCPLNCSPRNRDAGRKIASVTKCIRDNGRKLYREVL